MQPQPVTSCSPNLNLRHYMHPSLEFSDIDNELYICNNIFQTFLNSIYIAHCTSQMNYGTANEGPSIKYVTLFLMIFDPPPPVTNCHKSWTPPLKVCHTSEQKVNKHYIEEDGDCFK